MPTRCRNYNDDERPVHSFGCPQGASCRFVHPNDPRWAVAQKYDRSSSSGGRGGSRGRGGRASSSWGGPPPPPPPVRAVDTGWDPSSWGPTSTSAVKDVWGGSPSSTTSASTPTTVTTTKTTFERGPPSSSTHQSNTFKDPWGSSSANQTESGSNNESTKTGNGASGWDSVSDSGGWGSNNSGWGAGNGWGEGDTAANNTEKTQSLAAPWGYTEKTTRGMSWNMESISKDAPGITMSRPDTKSMGGEIPVQAKETVPKITPKTIPLPNRKSLRVKATNTLSDKHSPRESLTRSQIYSKGIRYTQQAVQLHIEHEAAQANVDCWKKTQLSARYSRASPEVRKILDEYRAKYALELSDITTQLNHTIEYLGELAHLPESLEKIASKAENDQLVSYTNQLREWIGDLQLYARHIPSRSPVNQGDSQPVQKSRWQEIQASLSGLEESIEILTEQTYLRSYTNIVDVDTLFKECADSRITSEPTQPMSVDDRRSNLLQAANQVGNRVEHVAGDTAKMIKLQNHGEGELERLKAELTRNQRIEEETRRSFIDFEKWQEEDAVLIQRMTEQLQSLHMLPRPIAPPFNLDELLPPIKTLVMDMFKNEVIVIVNELRSACIANNDLFIADVYKQLQPTLDMTNALCQRAQAIL